MHREQTAHILMENHMHSFIGTIAVGGGMLISFSELEAWLRLASLLVGITIGLVSLYKMVKKQKK